jgi:hypothetical protein
LRNNSAEAVPIALNYIGETVCHSACNIDPLSRGIGVQN